MSLEVRIVIAASMLCAVTRGVDASCEHSSQIHAIDAGAATKAGLRNVRHCLGQNLP